MANRTTEVLFSYHIFNDDGTTTIDYTHQVPTFLCKVQGNPAANQRYIKAFVDAITPINSEHHEECMSKITRGCATCDGPIADALNSPMSYLDREPPMVIILVTPICGRKTCRIEAVKHLGGIQQSVMGSAPEAQLGGSQQSAPEAQLGENQQSVMQSAPEADEETNRDSGCGVCHKPTATRICGCGKVAYCSRGCQRTAWKKHKKNCGGQ